jgi:hypothetical protein
MCKAMSALTGVSQTVFFKYFSKIDDTIANAALAQSGDGNNSAETNALREHINALSAGEPVPPAQPLPEQLQPPAETPDVDVARYVERLRLALSFIEKCGGPDQAEFVLAQAVLAFPKDTTPAFTKQ